MTRLSDAYDVSQEWASVADSVGVCSFRLARWLGIVASQDRWNCQHTLGGFGTQLGTGTASASSFRPQRPAPHRETQP